jgi:UDP-N-acetylmuramyl pentapeptide phosphotransferase/UDP-N-acetylglucosamine-1-phosphate transferase
MEMRRMPRNTKLAVAVIVAAVLAFTFALSEILAPRMPYEVKFAFVAALALAAGLTPLARRVAISGELVAKVRPDRLARDERPYGGGLAIAATLAILAVGLMVVRGIFWKPDWLTAPELEGVQTVLARLAAGGFFFFVFGVLDDKYALTAWRKLVLQFVGAVMIVNVFDFRATLPLADPILVQGISTGWIVAVIKAYNATLPLADPVFVQGISMVWIVAVINAYNMFDHADGMAAAAGVVMLVALALFQVAMFEWLVPLVALAAAGALAGFLIYNFPPAKLFMGDAGSSLVGYLLAVLPLVARYDGRNRPESFVAGKYVFLVPAVLVAVPLFDMLCVIASRIARGESPLEGDATSHLAHRMLARGVRPRSIVIVVVVLTAMTGVAAVWIGAANAGTYDAAVGPDSPWPLAALVPMALAIMLIVRRRPRAAKS